MALAGLLAANNLNDVTDIERTWDNIGSNISATVFVPAPTLDLDFAANKSLVDSVSGNNLITFSRASTGTFVGSNGLVQTAASGVPRFDHNPATGESLGLLIEEARTNELTQSQTFSTWTLGNASITTNATTSPDGTNNASKLIEDSATSAHRIFRSINPSGNYTMSVFAKAAERNILTLMPATTGGGDAPVYFNLSNGTISTSLGSANSASIQSYPNGWYRCSVTDGTGGFGYPFIGVAAVSGTESYAGNGTSGIYIWGAQLEAGVFSTSYIPTTTATVTRAADIASITGSNFASWYNNNEGTLFQNCISRTPAGGGTGGVGIGAYLTSNSTDTQIGFARGSTEVTIYVYGSSTTYAQFTFASQWAQNTTSKAIVAYKFNDFAASANGLTVQTDTSGVVPIATELGIGQMITAAYNRIGAGTFSQIVYYSARLPNATLQALSTYGVVSSFPYSFSIKGKDILALKQVNRASTRDFVFIKGLASTVQPRITTASQYTASGVALRNAAMLKLAPTTSGNYFFSSGLTLSGATVQINGTNALSIATSPFSSSTATVPLLFAGLRPQANWRFTEPMVSGTVTAPEAAIPIETENFLLFMKAGQS